MQRDQNRANVSNLETTVAGARRLAIEKLELRSVLATFGGLPTDLAAIGLAEADLAALSSQWRPIAVQPNSSEVIAHDDLAPGNLHFKPRDLSLDPAGIEIGNADHWVRGDELIGNSNRMASFDSFSATSMASFVRIIDMIILPPEPAVEPAVDTPVEPADGESSESKDPSTDSSAPVQTPTTKPEKNTSRGGRIIWVESLETYESDSQDASDSYSQASASRLAEDATLSTGLNRPVAGEDKTAGRSVTKRDTAESATVADSSELESRQVHLGTFQTTDRNLPLVSRAPGSTRFEPRLNRNWGGNEQLASDLLRPMAAMLPVQVHNLDLEEGGLVELIAAESIRQNPRQAIEQATLPESSLFEAEVGIFQAIDVATSLAAEPSQAIMAPVVMVIAFQLFDQRRKTAELDREEGQLR